MAEVLVTVSGYVGNDPVLKRSKSDIAWISFRVGSNRKWKDLESGQWVESPTMWFTVKAWGNKAQNIADSVRKGTPVVVTGRLSEEPYTVTKSGGQGGDIIEYRSALTIENATIGLDLSRGVARYYRTDRDVQEPADMPAWVRNGNPKPANSENNSEGYGDGWSNSELSEVELQGVDLTTGEFRTAELEAEFAAEGVEADLVAV